MKNETSESNLRRRVVAPEGKFPIGVVDGDIVEFVGGAYGRLIADGGGEGSNTKRSGGAWETTEGCRRNSADRIHWIVLYDSHISMDVSSFFFLSL